MILLPYHIDTVTLMSEDMRVVVAVLLKQYKSLNEARVEARGFNLGVKSRKRVTVPYIYYDSYEEMQNPRSANK